MQGPKRRSTKEQENDYLFYNYYLLVSKYDLPDQELWRRDKQEQQSHKRVQQKEVGVVGHKKEAGWVGRKAARGGDRGGVPAGWAKERTTSAAVGKLAVRGRRPVEGRRKWPAERKERRKRQEGRTVEERTLAAAVGRPK